MAVLLKLLDGLRVYIWCEQVGILCSAQFFCTFDHGKNKGTAERGEQGALDSDGGLIM